MSRMRITKRNGVEYVGTAKVSNSSSASSANLERNLGHEPIRSHAITPLDTRVRIEVVSYRVRLADPDGVSCKYAIDGLVRAGVLKDDSRKYVKEVTYRQVKVRTKSEEKTELILEECE